MTDNLKAERRGGDRLTIYFFRITGGLLLLLILVPFYRLVGTADSDRVARDVIDAADLSRSLFLLGTLITLTIGVLASRVIDSSSLERALQKVERRLVAIPLLWFAGSLALVSGLLSLVFSLSVLEGKPNLIDAMAQLTHARFVAEGHLSGPVDRFSEFWNIPNSIVTPNGWVSQYPPGYVLLLALGMRLGAPQLVGPILVGVTVFFTALAAERLFPDDKVVARLGAVMLALSPFLLGLSAAFMNHIGAAAFISVAVYYAVRSRDTGSLWWAILCGAAVGAVFSIRPLSGVVAALVVAVVWLINPSMRLGEVLSRLLRLALAAILGIVPILGAIAAYNRHFFGSPFRFGYTAQLGPLVRPGFHRDPTGHAYGWLQALGYTSSDLVTLSMYLLETPIPVVGIIALFLLFAPRLERGTRIVALWALLPVVANASYWHHGIFMGPRMLNEWAPAWALLTAVAAVGLVRRIPQDRTLGNYSPRTALVVALLLAWSVGIVYLGPQRLARYGGSWMASTRLKIPATASPSLVFVHGGWPTRIATRLTAHGLRGDSLEAAMALNPTCDVHTFANWYAASPGERSADTPPLKFDFSAPNKTQRIEIAQGDEIRYYQGTPLSPTCLRQVASDTLGIIDIAPLVWQGDLPGLNGTGAMIVRDMGPEENARLIARYPGRVPMVLFRREKEGAPQLVPYDAGIKSLWPNG
jgi:Dolichyl-phosphate-mannose-protein mannosyltransferase